MDLCKTDKVEMYFKVDGEYERVLFESKDLTDLNNDIKSIITKNEVVLKDLMKDKRNLFPACLIVYNRLDAKYSKTVSDLVASYMSEDGVKNRKAFKTVNKYCIQLSNRTDGLFTKKDVFKKVMSQLKNNTKRDAKRIVHNFTVDALEELNR